MEECILSKNVRFYTMAFENKNSTTVFDYPMKNFIDQIDSAMKNTKHFPFRETRSVNGKIMRIFRPVYLETSRIYVISFGKLMNDKPYMACLLYTSPSDCGGTGKAGHRETLSARRGAGIRQGD